MTTAIRDITIGGRNRFDRRVERVAGEALRGLSVRMVQVNIGLQCNLACHHCHVESSPTRTEAMTWDTMESVLAAAGKAKAEILDITGGAPEMHPLFKRFVEAARDEGLAVIVRTNLTIMLEEGYRDLPAFFARCGVHLVASLPCYLESNVEQQRGQHVYHESIDVIRQLNQVGYGVRDELCLDLIYNPIGPSLPPIQAALEEEYRRALQERFGLRFTNLHTITNMAIGRFLHDLQRDGKAEAYETLLRDSFNAATLTGLMCRHQLHVGWDGAVYDCDYNFALSIPAGGARQHVRDFDPEPFIARRIATGEHCFGCAAGCGSSCNGALT